MGKEEEIGIWPDKDNILETTEDLPPGHKALGRMVALRGIYKGPNWSEANLKKELLGEEAESFEGDINELRIRCLEDWLDVSEKESNSHARLHLGKTQKELRKGLGASRDKNTSFMDIGELDKAMTQLLENEEYYKNIMQRLDIKGDRFAAYAIGMPGSEYMAKKSARQKAFPLNPPVKGDYAVYRVETGTFTEVSNSDIFDGLAIKLERRSINRNKPNSPKQRVIITTVYPTNINK